MLLYRMRFTKSGNEDPKNLLDSICRGYVMKTSITYPAFVSYERCEYSSLSGSTWSYNGHMIFKLGGKIVTTHSKMHFRSDISNIRICVSACSNGNCESKEINFRHFCVILVCRHWSLIS